MNPSKRLLISSLLQQEKLAVIATNSKKGIPQTALIAFAEDDDLCLHFQTGTHTRKAQNLKQSKLISLTVGLSIQAKMTLQYEGLAQQLITAEAIKNCKRMFLNKKSPTTQEYLERPDAIFFKITPTWLRLTDYTKMAHHPTVIELCF